MNHSVTRTALRATGTNTDIVLEFMERSSFGALSQVFVLQALEQYARDVLQASEDDLKGGAIPPRVWQGLAGEILEVLQRSGRARIDSDTD